MIKLYPVYFWTRDNQRYSKTSYISARNKYWLTLVSHMCSCTTLTVTRK